MLIHPPLPLYTKVRAIFTALCFAPIAAIMFIPTYAPVFASESALAAEGRALIDPAQIDRAVTGFTGVAIGEVGGARTAADKRLRLAACAQPLVTSWHTAARTAVRVECSATRAGTGPWRIFVATRPAANSGYRARQIGSVVGSSARPMAPVIKRGDPVTVMVRGRGFSVQQSGEALENGQVGDWIGIRTTRRGEPVRARIERPGLAVIPAG